VGPSPFKIRGERIRGSERGKMVEERGGNARANTLVFVLSQGRGGKNQGGVCGRTADALFYLAAKK